MLTRRKVFTAVLGTSATLLLGACTESGPTTPAAPSAATAPPAPPKAAPPTAAPSKAAAPAAPNPAASPATAAPAPTPKPVAPAPAAKPGLSAAEWEQLVAAAKRERQLVIFGVRGSEAQDALVGGFQKRFPEIEIDYTGDQPSRLAPKMLEERNAGMFRIDLYIGSTDPVFDFIPAGVVDQIRPFLVGPDVAEPKWSGGRFDFGDDKEKYSLVMSSYLSTPLAVNPRMINPNEFTSYKDLLKPQWKGKLAMYDPTVGGTGRGLALFLYLHKDLGKDYLRQLITGQELVIARDHRQLLDWVAQGRYSIGIATSDIELKALSQRGVPIDSVDPAKLAEGTYLAVGSGSVSVMNRAPHSNAVKLYLNWLLSQEGQTLFSRATGNASRRSDCPTDHLDPVSIPRPDGSYEPSYKQRYRKFNDELIEFLKTVIK